MTDNFIEIDRRFHLISEETAATEDFEDRIDFGLSKSLGWHDILDQPRSVIIAEAGAGKTEEIKQQTLRLRQKGKHAFFLRLENLKDDFEFGFEGADLGDLAAFDTWAQSDEKAWFFLDSVDEAKLRDPQDFERALFNFDKALKSKRENAHIIVTSRLTWEPVSDLNIVKKRLPFQSTSTLSPPNHDDEDALLESLLVASESNVSGSSQAEQEETSLSVYSLVRLDNDRIERFAMARNVDDIDAFMEALDRSDALSFAARPKDLDDLIEYWNTNDRIGSTLELAEHSIGSKIVELNNSRLQLRPLGKTKALYGAKRIAAATSLTRWSRLAIPDQEEVKDAIPIGDILPEWELTEAKTLLERALFDEAVYGIVRFHHRSVREYLAAQWFLECLKAGSRRNITQMFFRQQYGIQLITPSLRPILPWIAIFDDNFREMALNIAPEILLQGGDSSQFPLETRKQVLLGVCQKLAENKTNRESFDIATIQRFARDDMEETVRALLEEYCEHEEVQNLLLKMVWQGRYVTCAIHALSVAKTENKNVSTRVLAIRALHAAASNDQRHQLRDFFVSQTGGVKQPILAELVATHTPTFLEIPNLFLLFEKLEHGGDRHDRYELKYCLKKLVDKLEPADLKIFADNLASYVKREPHIEQHGCDISKKYRWLIGTAFWVCKHLIKAHSSHMLTDAMLRLLSSLARYSDYRGYDYNDARSELPKLIFQWPELNYLLFWHEVQTRREKSEKNIDDHRQVQPWRAFWSLEGISLQIVINWIETKEVLDDKLIALSIAFDKYVTDGRKRKTREKLKSLASMNSDLSDQLRKYLNPAAMSKEQNKLHKYNSNIVHRQKEQEARQAKIRKDWNVYLREHLDQVRDAGAAYENKFFNSQRYLYERMRKLRTENNKLGNGNWQILESDQGTEVAEAFREFLIDCAKAYKPEIRSEGIQKPNAILEAVQFGLSGLEIESSETPNWTNHLTKKMAEDFVRYTFKELNGVPTWLPQLHKEFPDIVEHHFIQELTWELTEYDGEVPVHYALSSLKYHCDWLHGKLARPLYDLLKTYKISDGEHLTDTLQIVFSDAEITNGEIAELASARAREVAEENIIAIWFAAWVSVDPEIAIEELRLRLERISDEEAATQFAMRFIVALVGSERRDHTINSRDVFKSPKCLCGLHLLLHQYIKIDEDIDRANGGIYSPELRDDAQDARTAIFNLLTEIPGKEAFLALQRIAEEHPHEVARNLMRHHLIRRAEADADIANWSLEDVVDFEHSSEMTPRTAKQLFELSVNHLHDLKYWLEDGEDSAAATWKRETEETKLRISISAWLRRQSQKRYTVHQEEEQADKKRPDIRFHTVGVDAPVPVELKIADNNWSGANLFERLENQLCNDYLRDWKSNYGVFLLMYRGEKSYWIHPLTKQRMTFDLLVNELQDHARNLIAGRSDIEQIEVIGIDLAKRAIENRG